MMARREVVEAAYTVFRKYRRRLVGTTMYWTLEDPEVRTIHRRVKETPLHSLDPRTLQYVLMNATADDRSLKHFLPRVLDCIASGALLITDLTDRLQPEQIADWPEDEARALRDFLAAIADIRAEPLLSACEQRLSKVR